MPVAESGHILGHRRNLQARDHLYGLAAHGGKICDQLVDFAAGHFVFDGVSKHRDTAGTAYPVYHLSNISPLLLDVPCLTGAQILFKCLLDTANGTHSNQMLGKVGAPYLAS